VKGPLPTTNFCQVLTNRIFKIMVDANEALSDYFLSLQKYSFPSLFVGIKKIEVSDFQKKTS
jgi:hypothetical protein